MIPLLLAAIAVAVVIFVIIYLIRVHWDTLAEWFQQKEGLIKSDEIAALIKTTLESGAVIIQGIFKKKTGAPVEGRVIHHKDIDSKTSAAFRESSSGVLIVE
ncbi:hypothetical protein [Planktothricoides sp. SR001]|uniref:hypothetical protein n=1 Tax=Planktothricoides sp. SR001 TaxID=1705388 RepID=UPI0012E0CFF0|nr:hypothetical protein [Planktothricoides sp. SR001]